MSLEDYRAYLKQRLEAANVPTTLHTGLIEYLASRRPVGSFLTAVLCNDLREAAMRADEQNRFALKEIVLFLHMFAPAPSWGSTAAVAKWLTDPNPAPEVYE